MARTTPPPRSSTRAGKSPASPQAPLSAAARQLLLAVSLSDRPLPVGWLEYFSVTDSEIDALLAGASLVEADDGFAPGPALERETFSKSATWSERRRAHLTLAQASLQPPARFESAAQHFELAGKSADAARAWLRAAETHGRRHRHAAASRCFCAALRLLPADTDDAETISILKNLERCASLGRDIAAVIARLEDWRATPPWRERPAVRAEASLTLAALLSHTARHVESAQARRAAAHDLRALGRIGEAARTFLAAASTLAFAVQLTSAAQTADDALRTATEAGDIPTIAEATKLSGFILGMQGNTAEGRARVEHALALALKHQLPGVAADAYRLLGSIAEYASCYVDEQAAFSSALAFCRRHDQDVIAGLCLGCLAYSFFRSGNWKRSEATTRRVLADRHAHPASRMIAEGVLGLLHAHRGETRSAVKLLNRSLQNGRQMGITAMDFFSLLGLALTAENAGDHSQAAAHYRAIFDVWRTTEDRHDAIPGLSCAVTFHARRGERDETAEYAEALEHIAASTANPEAAGAAHFAAAELLLLDGETSPAITAFRAALAAFEKRELSTELIRVRLRLAAALTQTGARDEARALLQDVAKRARRLGARPLAALAAAQLFASNTSHQRGPAATDPATAARSASRDIAASARTRSNDAGASARSTWDLLSPRQRDIARHLAQGAANKEIAAALNLSVRTVEMHVADVLTRLDCRSRAQAAARITAALA
jgi:DNA-binding NarL/FixJ family response regulator